jgi:transcriptional regulator
MLTRADIDYLDNNSVAIRTSGACLLRRQTAQQLLREYSALLASVAECSTNLAQSSLWRVRPAHQHFDLQPFPHSTLDNRQEKWQSVVEYRGDDMPTPTDLLQGTLDLLILRTLALESMHGWGIAQRIQQVSKDVLQIGQGSLYPALSRLEYKGWIKSEWGNSENNRRAKFYKLTATGRKRLEAELESWERLSTAIDLVLGKAAEVRS